jgi:oxygen-independent coproporphyrinogen-3 oxidase
MDWHTPSKEDCSHFDPQIIYETGLALHHIANTAYPIGHITTMRPYRIDRSAVQHFAPLGWQEVDRLGLYVHIPFCEKRCGFCEYAVVDPVTNASSQDLYFNLLLKEFTLYREAIQTPAKTLVGFDIGGGTPSTASVANIASVLQAAQQHFILPENVAISIETTPKIAAMELEKMKAYYSMGIRRISMGVQTINPRLLEALGRTGTSLGYNQNAVENIRAAGFKSFNIDVMYGFAHQTLSSMEATLKHVISLYPEHVTLYRTRYKGTRIAAQAENVSLENVTAQAEMAKQMLLEAGYAGTRGKNTFSRVPGSMGTSDYLTERVIHGTPYLGLGLGAQSLSHKNLAYNSGAADKRLDQYQRQILMGHLPIQDLYHLSREAAMGKMISVSFYFGEINLQSFALKFGLALEDAFPEEVAFVIGNDLMAYHPAPDQPRTLRLTARGEQTINGVIALFYAGAVKAHLLNLAGTTAPVQIVSAPFELVAS